MNFIKKILPAPFKRKIKEKLGVPGLHWSLENLKKNGFNPGLIIDIGAYEGHWTRDTLEVFPAAKILMIEAQQQKEPQLKKISRQFPNTDVMIVLLSAAAGKSRLFLQCETGSHIIDQSNPGDTIQTLLTQTLDNCLAEKNMEHPDLLKLDVQGHEMEVLKGGRKALLSAEVCLLEISLLNLGDNSPLIGEMITYMDENNFQPYDISSLMRRPFDKALYQVDMFFVKKDSKLVAGRKWN